MGLTVYASFQTPEGFPITSVYCRIVEVIFRPHGAGECAIVFRTEFYVDRDARINGRLPIRVPTIGDTQTFIGTLGSMPYLYGVLKDNLQASGITVEDVLEDPPTAPVPDPVPAEQPPAETPPS